MPLNTEALISLGWNAHFQQQLSPEELEQTIACRVMAVHRGQLIVSAGGEETTLELTGNRLAEQGEEQMTIGDWLLLSEVDNHFVRLLERTSLIQRQAAGTDKSIQMVAANVDTLFIVTSCNDDFNLSRLERYLALAHTAEVFPVIILTKSDTTELPDSYLDQSRSLGPDIIVEIVNALEPSTLQGVQDWCKPGQTIALVGSSGVGKSTLANALGAELQKTGAIREDDAKGRHTTTHRTLLPLRNGAVLLDSPGMRGLGLADIGVGVAATFEDVVELAQHCRYKNCLHDSEPGCAVKEAVENNLLSPRRIENYNKLVAEQEHQIRTIAERRKKEKDTAKLHKRVQSQKPSRRDG